MLWDELLQVLWWADIQNATLWQYSPSSGRSRYWTFSQRLASFVLTQQPHVLVIGLAKNVAEFDARTGAIKMLADVEPDMSYTRINDGRADRWGNYIFGTMNERDDRACCSFYRYTPWGILERLALPTVAIANSIAFSPDGGVMYWCDSRAACILAADYMNGDISRIRLFADLRAGSIPDGSTIDADGCLWNAEWGSACLTRYAVDGTVLARYTLPVSQATCMAFGGTMLDHLYVTTAYEGLSDVQRGEEPQAGAVFELTGHQVQGLREARFGYVLH